MEESKPRVRRAGSSHVIDLRAAGAATPKPASLKPKAKAVATKSVRRPLAAPNQSKVPVRAPQPAPDPPLASSAAAPLGNEPSLSPRRFWPAFWRFLVLLIVLAALVSGGFYLYINYFRG